MIEYVVNFDEMEDALVNMLSSIKKKNTKSFKELKSKETSFIIPPLKGSYRKTTENEGKDFLLQKILITIDGYNSSDDFEILIDNESIGVFTFSYNNFYLDFISLINFSKMEIIYYNESALYRNLNITLFLIKEE